MLLSIFKNEFLEVLKPLYGVEEALSLFYLSTEEVLGLSKVDIALDPNHKLMGKQKTLLTAYKERLETWEPIQYIIGKTAFYGSDFKVTSDTLIPRPETEALVDWMVEDLKAEEIKILDVGTGTGCIAISLAKHLPKAKVYAMDVSKKALAIAKENAALNNVKIECIEQDVLALEGFTDSFDVIVSNPPYVRNAEKKEMRPNVLDFEPDLALFVEDEDPLIFYKKIAQLCASAMPKKLYFEINEYLGKEMLEMLSELEGRAIEIKQDFRGKERMLKVKF